MPPGKDMIRQLHPLATVEDYMPSNYFMDDDGNIYKRSKGGDGSPSVELITRQSLCISELYTFVETGEAAMQISWRPRKNWKHCVIPKADLYNERKAASILAGRGLNVSSVDIRKVINYLQAFEDQIRYKVKHYHIASSYKWVADPITKEIHGFVLGVDWIGNPKERTMYHPTTAEAASIASGLAGSGSVDNWIAGTKEMLARYPLARVGVVASLASPLLTILKQRGFVVDFAHETSGGKTILLEICASIWGDPNTLVIPWRMTRTGATMRAGIMGHLPLFLDDSKQADPKHASVSSLVYDFTNAGEMTRGTPNGIANRSTWRLIILSTGEQSLIEFSGEHGGAQARCIPFWGSIWGEKTRETARALERMRQSSHTNAGTIGRQWITWLWENRSHWDAWAELHSKYLSEISDTISTSNAGVGYRLASYIATLQITAELASDALGLPLSCSLSELTPYLTEVENAGNTAAEAFERLIEFCNANRSAFASEEYHWQDTAPGGKGWLGWWPIPEEPPMITPARMREILRWVGQEPGGVLRAWKDRGWIKPNGKNLGTNRTIHGVGLQRVVILDRDKWANPLN